MRCDDSIKKGGHISGQLMETVGAPGVKRGRKTGKKNAGNRPKVVPKKNKH
jgi:hypothetical protein